MNRIAVFGDVHGHLDKMIEMMNVDEIDFAIQVGDFGAYLPTSNLSAIPKHHRNDLGQFGEYFKVQKPFPVPTYFCKGNHEDFELLARYETKREVLPNLFYVSNGLVLEIQGLHIAFLGGNFSSKWFNKSVPNKCQSQKILGYLRQKEINEIKSHRGNIDILITHEPSFGPQFRGDQKYGCQAIHDLIENIQPTYAFSGHIHKYAEGTVGRTKCIALGAVNYNSGKSIYQFAL